MSHQSPESAEIAYLEARCRLVLDAIEASDPEAGTLPAELRAIVADTSAKGNVAGLRTIRRDLLEMSRALPVAARQVLQVALDAQAADDPYGRAAG